MCQQLGNLMVVNGHVKNSISQLIIYLIVCWETLDTWEVAFALINTLM